MTLDFPRDYHGDRWGVGGIQGVRPPAGPFPMASFRLQLCTFWRLGVVCCAVGMELGARRSTAPSPEP